MKASTSPTTTRSVILPRLDSLIARRPSSAAPSPGASSDVLEGAELAGDAEVGDHDDDRHQGEGRRERLVVGDRVEDRGADELFVGDQFRRQVVTEGEREGEDRDTHDRREGAWQ